MAGSGEDGYTPLVAMYFLFIALALSAGTLWFQVKYIKWIPFQAIIFVEGILLGFLDQFSGQQLGDLSRSIKVWEAIDPFLLMAVFLPALVFGDAMKESFHLLVANLNATLLLAIPGVIAMAFGVGYFAHLTLGYGWGLSASFLLGSVLSAPDPVSVAALMESSPGVPTRLKVLMGSESHIADLSALVLFKLFLTFVTEGSDLLDKPTEMAKFFANMLLVGPAIGLAFGFAGYFVIKQSVSPTRSSDVMIQVTTTLIIAYMSFLVSEHNFHSNGVVSSVICAWVIASYAWPKFCRKVVMENVWETVEFFGNSMIYFLAGVILGTTLYSSITTSITAKDWLNVLLIWTAIFCARLVVVTVLYLAMLLVGRKFALYDIFCLTWGGLRGAVTVTLAIVVLNTSETAAFIPILQEHFGAEYEEQLKRFFFIVGCVTLLTLVVNFTTFPIVLRFFGLSVSSQSKSELNNHVRKRIRESARDVFDKVTASDDGYSAITFESIQDLISGTIAEEAAPDATEDESDRIIDPDMVELGDCRKKKLKQVRTMFLNAVRAQYWRQINEGKIPRKSTAALKLLNSVDVGSDTVSYELDDFAPLHLMKLLEKVPLAAKAFGCIDSCLPDCITIDDWFKHRIKNSQREQTVLVATSFIEAHIVAEKKIAEYVGEDETIDTPEEAYVIKESRALREQAQEFLRLASESDADIIEHVRKLKVASCIIEHRRLYLEELKEQGLIEESFFDKQMEQIRADQVRLEKERRSRFKSLASKRVSLHRIQKRAGNGGGDIEDAAVTPGVLDGDEE